MKRLLYALVGLFMVLAVVGGAAQAADRSIGEKMDDAKITTAVKTKLTADRVKNLVDIGVETNDGVVRLSGKVPRVEDKFEAERITRRAKGVREVKNELKVEGASPSASPRQGQAADRSIGEKMDDAKITTSVKAKLTADRVKNLVDVGVETNDGVVRLFGKVPRVEDKFEAERITRRTKGVREVNNELRVEAPSPSASPRQK